MGELDDVLSWIAGIESDDNTDLDDDGLKRWLAQHIVARDAAIRAEAKREERARIATDGYVPASKRDAYKAKAEEWERQVGEITDRLMTIVDDEIGVVPTAGPHESMDRIVAGLRAFRAEAEEWQARAEALAGVLREIAKPVDCLVKFREDSGARDERKVRALERIADAVCKLLDALPGGSRD